MSTILPPDNEMSSSAAALRARQLLASKESDNLLDRLSTTSSPTNGVATSSPPSSPPKRGRPMPHVRVETLKESSSRVKEILSTMKDQRESFSTLVHDTRILLPSEKSSSSVHDDPLPPTIGKPPRFSASTEREELTKKMSQSLKEKRARITRISSSSDHQKLRVVMSRSPHTIDTESTTEDTTEDSHSMGSWSGENVVSSTKAITTSLQEIQEVLEQEEDESYVEQGESRTEPNKTPYNRPQEDSQSGHFLPIIANEETADNRISKEESTPEDQNESRTLSEEMEGPDASPVSGDKKVSFGDTLFVIEQMTPPSVVHCTSFDSAFSRERSLSGYAPDDLSASIGATESPIRGSPQRRKFSQDTSDVDESDGKKDRYSSLVKNRAKRVTLMKKLEETYSELLHLHKELEYTREQDMDASDDEESASSCEILVDEESSCEFTDDSNTSGWVSQDESNSKIDSLLQYMTSEDDDSFAESSHGRLSLSLSRTTSNLDTLIEADETEEHEMSDHQPERENATTEASLSWNDESARRDASSGSYSKEDMLTEDLSLDRDVKQTQQEASTSESINTALFAAEEEPVSQSADFEKTPDSSASSEKHAHSMASLSDEYKDPESDMSAFDINRIPKSDGMALGTLSADTIDSTKHKVVKPANALPEVTNKSRDSESEEKSETIKKSCSKDSQGSTVSRDLSIRNSDIQESTASSVPQEETITKSSSRDSKDSSLKKKSIKKSGSKDSKDSSKKKSIKKFAVETIQIPTRHVINVDKNKDESVHIGPKGTVRREIDKWEASKGQPETKAFKPKKPDPPVASVIVENIVQTEDNVYVEVWDEALVSVTSETTPSQAADDTFTEEKKCDDTLAETNVETSVPKPTSDEAASDKETPREPTRRLFIPTKISNRRCRASGGLFDLARKTGISNARTICVKSIDIPRPPEITAINAEFNCGTQGSLYNLALRSGCAIEEQPILKRLKMPPLGGGKRRWLLKARGGHYHISVWTTISNAVMTARVGYSVQEHKKGTREERIDVDCGARGTRHIAERS